MEFSMDIEFKTEASLRFSTFFQDKFELEADEDRNLEFDNMKGDGVVTYYEERNSHFVGTTSLTHDSKSSFILKEVVIEDVSFLEQTSKKVPK